jgi:hypothetical protein
MSSKSDMEGFHEDGEIIKKVASDISPVGQPEKLLTYLFQTMTMFGSILAFPLLMFVRHDFGERYLSIISALGWIILPISLLPLFGAAWLSSLISGSFLFLITSPMFLFIGLPLLCISALLYLFVHKRRVNMRAKAGDILYHSRYSGTSIFDVDIIRKWIPNPYIFRVLIEPISIYLLGCIFSWIIYNHIDMMSASIIRNYFVFVALFMVAEAIYTERSSREQILDMIDADINSRMVRAVMESIRKPNAKPLSNNINNVKQKVKGIDEMNIYHQYDHVINKNLRNLWDRGE